MTESKFMDKYPIHTLTIQKQQTNLKSIDEILSHFKTKIDKHQIATYISIFDHYSHTQNIDGEIDINILNAKNIIFCFGVAIPTTSILAVRPRSIGVAELKDSYVVEFMEAPNEKLHEVMKVWTKEILNNK